MAESSSTPAPAEAVKTERASLEQAIEDAERMLYFATQGKIDDRADLNCLRELAKATEKIRSKEFKAEDLSHFYSQLSIMSHILYPVTSESLWVMEEMSKHLRRRTTDKRTFRTALKYTTASLCASFQLCLFVALIIFVALIVTPLVFNSAMQGSQLVSRLDKTIKERIELKQAEDKKRSPSQEDESASSADNATSDEEKDAKNNSLQMKARLIKVLVMQLDAWQDSWVTLTISKNFGWNIQALKKDGPPSANEPSSQKNAINLKELEKGLNIKNASLLSLQTTNKVLLPLLFGFCGAAAFILKKTIQSIQAHTFTGIHCTVWIRLLLGTFCGFFLGYLGSGDDLLKLLGGDTAASTASVNISLISPLTLAFIGGYSIDLLFGILNRFIYAVTNEDKYLPTSEVVKRKVDVNKFLDKAPNHSTFMGTIQTKKPPKDQATNGANLSEQEGIQQQPRGDSGGDEEEKPKADAADR